MISTMMQSFAAHGRPAGLYGWLAAVLVATSPALAERVDFDRWYVVMMGEHRVGWAHMRQHEADGRIISEGDMSFSLRRGEMQMQVAQGSRFVETLAGEPVEARATTNTGRMEMVQTLRFGEDEWTLEREQAGRTQSQVLPAPAEPWLAPAAAQREVEEQMKQGAETIRVRTMDLLVGPRPFETTMTIVGEQEVEVFGRVVPAVVWEARVSAMPGIRTREYVDARGRTLKSTTAMMPGMDITLLAADRDLAMSEVDPPEMLASLFISPDRPIPEPRRQRLAVYRLTFDGDVAAADAALPRTGFQRVAWGNERTAVVAVDLDSPVNPGDDLPGGAELAGSGMIDHEDPKVRELLAEALGDEDGLGDAAKADRLRRFVRSHIVEKDLSVGMGTASEVARTGQGDCTEHAVLLTALLRAAGIPARTATGLIYVDAFIGAEQVFGGHMWTQAWLPADGASGEASTGKGWVDVDATLPGASYDAAHITLGTSSMADDAMTNDLVALVPLLGRLKVEVLELATDPAGADSRR